MATWRSFLKEYEAHVRDTRKTDPISQQPFAICGEKILEFSFQSIDHAYFSALDEGRMTICPKCLVKIVNTLKKHHK